MATAPFARRETWSPPRSGAAGPASFAGSASAVFAATALGLKSLSACLAVTPSHSEPTAYNDDVNMH